MHYGEVLGILQRQVKVYGSQKKLAEQIGISPQYLGDILRCNRIMGQKVLNWLGMQKRITYEYKK